MENLDHPSYTCAHAEQDITRHFGRLLAYGEGSPEIDPRELPRALRHIFEGGEETDEPDMLLCPVCYTYYQELKQEYSREA